MENWTCHLCGAQDVVWHDDFTRLARVTSDCRIWPRGGTLGCCSICRTVVKSVGQQFLSDCAAIYEAYEVYYQADGSEQRVFEQKSGLSASRSEKIISRLMQEQILKPVGRLLDVGCGNGSLLKVFGKLMPSWQLAGHELSDKHKDAVSVMDNVYAFYSGELEQNKERFELITLIHALEHIVNPVSFLEKLKNLLTSDGYLMIQVPDFTRNPFDLVIADHCTHFDAHSIFNLLVRCGFRIVLFDEIVPKELTIVAVAGEQSYPSLLPEPAIGVYSDLSISLRWLFSLVEDANRLVSVQRFGIFGTSIAGIWLWNELCTRGDFFVDEDSNRVGGVLYGRPIIAPSSVQPPEMVYLPYPYPYVTDLFKRLKAIDADFRLPPQLK